MQGFPTCPHRFIPGPFPPPFRFKVSLLLLICGTVGHWCENEQNGFGQPGHTEAEDLIHAAMLKIEDENADRTSCTPNWPLENQGSTVIKGVLRKLIREL